MALFDFGKKEIKKLSAQVLALQAATVQQLNRNIAIYPPWSITENADRYVTTDDIYSIVRMLANTAATVPIYGYEVKNDSAAKQLKRIFRPATIPLQTKALQLKAYVDLPENDPLNLLLENPSDNYPKLEWLEAIYTSLLLNGEAFLLKERPGEGKNATKPTSLLFMHAEHIVLLVSDELPRRIVGYKYAVNGQIIFDNLPQEDVIHIKYFNPTMTKMGDELRGLSPIQVLKKRLTQNDGITDVTTAQMQNGGIETIVWDKAPYDAQAVEIMGKHKDNFYRFLKDRKNAGAPYFTAGEMGALHIGSTLADMKVLEAANVTFKKFCNAYGTSDILFNNGEASTESNVREMVKRTYTNTILPNVYRVRDALIKGLLPDFKDGKKRDIREDISEIAELQPNSKEMAEWLAIAWWVPPNDKLEMMRFERNPNPIMDQPLIPVGLQTLDELSGIAPIEPVTENGN